MSEKRFYPVRGIEKTIKNLEITDGYIYFATDTGHIYMDVDDSRVNMISSGATTFFIDLQAEQFGKQDILDNYTFYKSLLEKDIYIDIIQPNDLFINVPTGQLFKVTDITDNAFICTEIIIKGTSSEGETHEIPRVSLNMVSSTFPDRFVYGQEYLLYFIADTARSPVDNSRLDDQLSIELIFQAQDGTEKNFRYPVEAGVEFSLDIGSNLFMGNNKITIIASGDNSGRIEKKYYQKEATVLSLERNTENNFAYKYYTKDEDVTVSCIVNGAVDKQIIIKVDSYEIHSQYLSSDVSGVVYNHTLSYSDLKKLLGGNPLYGTHEVEINLIAEAGKTVISADPLRFEIAYLDEENPTMPIAWFPDSIPSYFEQYQNFTLLYMAYDPDITSNFVLQVMRNDIKIISDTAISYTPGSPMSITITEFENGDQFQFKFVNNKTAPISKSFTVVTSGSSRNLDIITENLILNLAAAGRTNGENDFKRVHWYNTNKDTTTERKEDDSGTQFNNFNWQNNGWIKDSEGNTCLRISNGANIFIPFPEGSNVLNSDSLPNSLALEFKFKIRNITEYSTLITHEAGANNEDVLKIESEKSVFGKIDGQDGQVSLLLGTQETVLNYGAVLNVRYKEDEMIQLSVVFDAKRNLIQMYLNGILSSAQHFNNFINLNSQAEGIEFNSKYCDLDLYNVRIYNGPFSLEDVVHNYIANLSGQARLDAYEVNQIVTHTEAGEPTIDFNKMVAYNELHPDNPIMPYAVVKVFSDDDLLPYYKGNDKSVAVKFVNPYLDYLWNNKDSFGWSPEKIEAFSNVYLHSCPSFTLKSSEKNFNVQGTSSQGYPRRNYKLKTKLPKNTPEDSQENFWRYTNGPKKDQNINKKWYMDSDLPADKFCWKADYMESSGSYNTGFANFVSILYEHHPLYNILKNEDYDKYRTTVYGFPMLVFQERQQPNSDGTINYEFVGKYNFNLDKSSNSRYGFELEIKNPFADNEIQKVAECWELTNNQGTYCAFDTAWPQPNENFEDVFNSFEYRYNPDEDGMDKLYDDYPWSDSSYAAGYKTMTYGDNTPTNTPRGYLANLEVLYKWIHSTKDDLSKFRSEFDKHLNKEYCLIYFIITELLHCYDSRGKNMMLASWGPEERENYYSPTFDKIVIPDKTYYSYDETNSTYLEVAKPYSENLNPFNEGYYEYNTPQYIWYPIFYDVDTQLGLNNSGEQLWDYYAEPTDDNLFATNNSILWKNFWAVFSQDIKNKYNQIRNDAQLGLQRLNGYYNFNPEYTNSYAMHGQRPLVVYNIDEYYKYIAPSYEAGFINTSGKKDSDAFGHLYCLQGTRELSRLLYLTNRINYLDSKWQAGAYAYESVNGGGFETRLNANYLGSTSDSYIVGVEPGYTTETDEQWPNELDSNPQFSILPFLKQYVSVYYDEIKTSPVQYSGNSILTEPRYELADSANFEEVYISEDNCESFEEYEISSISDYNTNKNNLYILDIDQTIDLENADASTGQIIDDAITLGRLYVYIAADNKYHKFSQEINDQYHPTEAVIILAASIANASMVNQFNYTDFYIEDGEGGYIQASTYNPETNYYKKIQLYINNSSNQGSPINVDVPTAIVDSYKTKPNLSQQLAYIPGPEYISDLGDLSTKYFNQFNIGGAYRLRSLILGSDVTIDGVQYENQLLRNILLASSKDDLHPKALLQEINLNGLTYFNSVLDISGCEKLQKFSALRTKIPQVAFSDGVQLKTAKFPSTLKSLTLVEPTELTELAAAASAEEGLYIDGLTNYINETELNILDLIGYLTDGNPVDTDLETSLNKISITGGKLGYQTYKLLKLLVNIKLRMIKKAQSSSLAIGNSRILQIGLRKVNWSPYIQIYSTNELEDNITYYKDNGRFTLDEINVNSISENDINNGLIFKIGSSAESSTIQDLDLLEAFIYWVEHANNKSQNFFRNDNPLASGITLPTIEGIIYVNNSNPYSEIKLKEIQDNYPGLRIFCSTVEKNIKFSFYQNNDLDKENPQFGNEDYSLVSSFDFFSDEEESGKTLSALIVEMNSDNQNRIYNPDHYDFDSWQTTEDDGSIKLINSGGKLDLSNGDGDMLLHNGDELKFYSINSLHGYNVYFKENIDDTEILFSIKKTIAEPLVWSDIQEQLALHYPYKDDSRLSYNQVYEFIGFNREANVQSAKAEFSSNLIQGIKIANDITFVAVFKETNILNTQPNEDLFAINRGVITPKAGVVLRGKILIPSSINNEKVTALGVFAGSTNINTTLTHIFLDPRFKNSNEKLNINNNAFRYCNSLVYFDFTNVIGVIGKSAFQHWENEEIQSVKRLSVFPDGIFKIYATEIQDSAFMSAFFNDSEYNKIQILSSNNDNSIKIQGSFVFGLLGVNYISWQIPIENYKRLGAIQIGDFNHPVLITLDNASAIFRTNHFLNSSPKSYEFYFQMQPNEVFDENNEINLQDWLTDEPIVNNTKNITYIITCGNGKTYRYDGNNLSVEG